MIFVIVLLSSVWYDYKKAIIKIITCNALFIPIGHAIFLISSFYRILLIKYIRKNLNLKLKEENNYFSVFATVLCFTTPFEIKIYVLIG